MNQLSIAKAALAETPHAARLAHMRKAKLLPTIEHQCPYAPSALSDRVKGTELSKRETAK